MAGNALEKMRPNKRRPDNGEQRPNDMKSNELVAIVARFIREMAQFELKFIVDDISGNYEMQRASSWHLFERRELSCNINHRSYHILIGYKSVDNV